MLLFTDDASGCNRQRAESKRRSVFRHLRTRATGAISPRTLMESEKSALPVEESRQTTARLTLPGPFPTCGGCSGDGPMSPCIANASAPGLDDLAEAGRPLARSTRRAFARPGMSGFVAVAGRPRRGVRHGWPDARQLAGDQRLPARASRDSATTLRQPVAQMIGAVTAVPGCSPNASARTTHRMLRAPSVVRRGRECRHRPSSLDRRLLDCCSRADSRLQGDLDRRPLRCSNCRAGLLPYFDAVCPAVDLAGPRRAPDFIACCAKLGIEPTRCLVLEIRDRLRAAFGRG